MALRPIQLHHLIDNELCLLQPWIALKVLASEVHEEICPDTLRLSVSLCFIYRMWFIISAQFVQHVLQTNTF